MKKFDNLGNKRLIQTFILYIASETYRFSILGEVNKRFMRKVLQIFSYFRPDFTGEGIYFEKLQKYFKENGIDSTVLAVKTAKPVDAHVGPNGALSVEYLGQGQNSALVSSLVLAIWLVRNLRQYDTVHFHAFPDRYYFSYIVCGLFGVRVLQSCTLNDSPYNILQSYTQLWRWPIRRLLGLADCFVVISPKLRDSARLCMPERKLRFIPQGVAIADIVSCTTNETRRRFGYRPDDVVLLFVGGLCERKGVDFLIETFPKLLAYNSKVRLMIVGPDLEDDYADSLRKRVVELNIQDQVLFTGALDELDGVYRLSDVLVFASHQEGFGNVLLEAMAQERAVVSRRLHGVTDYFIEHGETGFLFEDEGQYVDAVKRLIDDPALRRSVGMAARREIEENFALSEISRRYIELYYHERNE